jgi:K+ transporter
LAAPPQNSGDATAFMMVVLATIATVIESQSIVSGVYSLNQWDMQLGFPPRNASAAHRKPGPGQI